MILQGHVSNKNHWISFTRVPMATKLDRIVTYLDGILPIKSHDSFITWSWEIMLQTKTTISPIPQCLWPPNLVGRWLTLSGSHPQSYLNIDHLVLLNQVTNWKHYIFHYCIAYDHQTWQSCDLPWGAPIIVFTWPFNYVVLLDHVTN